MTSCDWSWLDQFFRHAVVGKACRKSSIQTPHAFNFGSYSDLCVSINVDGFTIPNQSSAFNRRLWQSDSTLRRYLMRERGLQRRTAVLSGSYPQNERFVQSEHRREHERSECTLSFTARATLASSTSRVTMRPQWQVVVPLMIPRRKPAFFRLM